jgi:mycothiol synthase
MSITLPDLDAVTARLRNGYRARPFREEDREPLVANRNEDVHPVQRGTAEEWRRWEQMAPDPTLFRVVVEGPDGVVAGANVSSGGPFRAPDGSARGGVHVAQRARRQGIGSVLLEVIETEARRLGAPRLLAGVSVHQPFAVEWASTRDYVEIGRRIQSFVELERFDPARFEGQRRRPLAGGIRYASVSELLDGRDEAGRERVFKDIYEAEREPFEDVPTATPMSHWSYEIFRRVWDEPNAAPDVSIVALDGERVIALTTSYRTGERDGGTGFTGVAREYRGRGIAFGMKVEMLARAKTAGLRSMLTTNDEPNKAMRGINAQLGYEMLPAHIQLEKKFA